MSLFLLHIPIPTTTTTQFSQFSKLITTTNIISCSYSKPPRKKPQSLARDRVIDFGRHKGKPLGSLPSTYLKWISQNLRAGDFHDWAKLADQVLHDPVYKDRIEWELAENLLTGNINSSSLGESESAVSRLVEVSERFGWDNEDKEGWSKVDFQLLGTSNGGRIPRKVEGRTGKEELKMVDEKMKKKKKRELSESEKRRRERRMRNKMRIRDTGRGNFGNGEKSGGDDDADDDDDDDDDEEEEEDRTVEIKSRFPGRDALLKNVLRSKRFL
ncbi:hypothetical protein ACOSQ4_021571 [Xanthoceras sorbifolium]